MMIHTFTRFDQTQESPPGHARPKGHPAPSAPRHCGSCRFFHPLPQAPLGLCAHPDRRQLIDMIRVRRGELACRDIDGYALWTERQTEQATIALERAMTSPERPAIPYAECSWPKFPPGIVVEEIGGVH